MQATVAPPPPTVPAAATQAVVGTPTSVTFTDVDGTARTIAVPSSRGEMQALRARRSELSDQLQSAASRRNRLSEAMKSAPEGASRTGLESRLKVLDQRIVQIESDIALTGRQLSGAPAELFSGSRNESMPGDIPDNVATVMGVFTFFVLFPIALAFARNLWRRGNKAPVASALPPESAERLERLEVGVEAIAIEIERVSEGQRFVTRLLSEAQPESAIGRKIPQTIAAAAGEQGGS
ncbi:MAG: hypothetical protein H0U59_11195 [Gemmatimonadaceae bacterium]|nr:hypothetical protein [Gemmatimonadaceae bacterium]MDQ3244304.1 hypothetical protein [Gemmatimonadota bacterium]